MLADSARRGCNCSLPAQAAQGSLVSKAFCHHGTKLRGGQELIFRRVPTARRFYA